MHASGRPYMVCNPQCDNVECMDASTKKVASANTYQMKHKENPSVTGRQHPKSDNYLDIFPTGQSLVNEWYASNTNLQQSNATTMSMEWVSSIHTLSILQSNVQRIVISEPSYRVVVENWHEWQAMCVLHLHFAYIWEQNLDLFVIWTVYELDPLAKMQMQVE